MDSQASYMSDQRLTELENKMDKLVRSIDGLVKSFDELREQVKDHSLGIDGNEKHGIPSYQQRIQKLEESVSDLTEFKKKISYLAGIISTVVSTIMGFLGWIIGKVL